MCVCVRTLRVLNYHQAVFFFHKDDVLCLLLFDLCYFFNYTAWSEPDIVDVGDTSCACSKKPLPHCGCSVNVEINWREYVRK